MKGHAFKNRSQREFTLRVAVHRDVEPVRAGSVFGTRHPAEERLGRAHAKRAFQGTLLAAWIEDCFREQSKTLHYLVAAFKCIDMRVDYSTMNGDAHNISKRAAAGAVAVRRSSGLHIKSEED